MYIIRSMSTSKRYAWSLAFNCIIAISEALVLANCFSGYIGNHGQGFSMFHFFTEDSNCLLGISALLQICFCWRYFVDGKTTPRAQSVFKLIATCGTLTTFFVVLFYLMPVTAYFGYSLMMWGWPNMWLTHLVLPILGAVTYLFFEVEPAFDKKWAWAAFALSSVVTYAAIITPLASCHLISSDESVNNVYGFADVTVNPGISVLAVTLIITLTYFEAVGVLYLRAKIAKSYQKHGKAS